MIMDLIKQCIKNIKAYHKDDPDIVQIIEKYTPTHNESLLSLRAKFFILLHEDEYTRKELVQRKTKAIGFFGPVPVEKANRFYESLHNELLHQWVSNETISLHDFVDSLRMAYLIS